jgi:hypothetical protein
MHLAKAVGNKCEGAEAQMDANATHMKKRAVLDSSPSFLLLASSISA